MDVVAHFTTRPRRRASSSRRRAADGTTLVSDKDLLTWSFRT
jgi:hypothetical protein